MTEHLSEHVARACAAIRSIVSRGAEDVEHPSSS